MESCKAIKQCLSTQQPIKSSTKENLPTVALDEVFALTNKLTSLGNGITYGIAYGSIFTDTRVNWNLKIWASKCLTTSLGIKPWQKQRKASAFRFTEMVGKDNLDLSPIFFKAFTMIVMCYKYISEALNAFSFLQKLCTYSY